MALPNDSPSPLVSVRLRSYCLRLLVSSATSLICLLVAELFLRADDRHPEIAQSQININGNRYKIYERAETWPRIAGSVVFIGDSMTAGVVCGTDRNYPGAFRRLAQEQGASVSTLNLAEIDRDTFDYLSVARAVLAGDARPAAAIVTLFSNDIEFSCSLCPFLGELNGSDRFSGMELANLSGFCEICRSANNVRTAGFGAMRRLHRSLYRVSYVYRLARDANLRLAAMVGIEAGWGAARAKNWLEASSLDYRLLEFSLLRLVEEFRRAQIGVLVVMYPNISGMSPDNPWVEVYREVSMRLSVGIGSPVFSGYPAFLDDPDSEWNMRWSLTDGHPNCAAHELFATWVLEQAQAEGIVPASAPD